MNLLHIIPHVSLLLKFLKFIAYAVLLFFVGLSGVSKFFRRKYIFKTFTPDSITSSMWDEIIKLHQTEFKIDAQSIIQLLKERDQITIYTSGADRKIIATMGISWIKSDNMVASYMGSVVVCKSFQHHKIGVHMTAMVYFLTLLRYPFKRKFYALLTANPQVYTAFAKAKNHWPSMNLINQEMHGFCHQILSAISPAEFNEIHPNAFISHRLSKILNVTDGASVGLEQSRKKILSNSAKLFASLNKNYHAYEQLLIVTQVRFIEIMAIVFKVVGTKLPKFDLKAVSVGWPVLGRSQPDAAKS